MTLVFLASFWVKALILALVVLLFITTYILNKRTKAPKIDETIEKCASCTNESCMIKLSEIETIKLEYEKELKEHQKGELTQTIKHCNEQEKEKNNEK